MIKEHNFEDVNLTVEQIEEFERNHYFIDYKVETLPRWVREPHIRKEDLNHFLMDILSGNNYDNLRVFSERDLSEHITIDGKKMTLREFYFGELYQSAHLVIIDDYYNNQI